MSITNAFTGFGSKRNMQVPRKQHCLCRFSGGSENSCVRHRVEHQDPLWSYDFVSDRTEEAIRNGCCWWSMSTLVNAWRWKWPVHLLPRRCLACCNTCLPFGAGPHTFAAHQRCAPVPAVQTTPRAAARGYHRSSSGVRIPIISCPVSSITLFFRLREYPS